jgi:hypothetical protein
MDSNGVIYTERSGNYTVTDYSGINNEVIIREIVNGKIIYDLVLVSKLMK